MTKNEDAAAQLGFGCAHILRYDVARRARLIDAAWDLGLRHFDVAPMYGLGAAESELGRILGPRAAQASIVSKFGLPLGSAGRLVAPIQGAIRRLLEPLLARKRQRSYLDYGDHCGERDFSPGEAIASLERSLARLRVERLEALLLHEPSLPLLPEAAADSLANALESARAKGTIGLIGVGGEFRETHAVAGRFPRLGQMIQFPDISVADPAATAFVEANSGREPGSTPRISTFGIVGRLLPDLQRYLSETPESMAVFGERLGVDIRQAESLGRLLLRDAVLRNRSGLVLFSADTPEQLASNVTAAREGELDDEARTALRDIIRKMITARMAERQ